MTGIGRELGVVGDERWQIFSAKRERIEAEQQRLAGITVHPEHLSPAQVETFGGELSREQKALGLLRRPEVNHALLESIGSVGKRFRPEDETLEMGEQIAAQIEVQARYEGYVKRQELEIERARKQSEASLPEDIDYDQRDHQNAGGRADNQENPQDCLQIEGARAALLGFEN